MYAIYAYIDPPNHSNVGYGIHGVSGYCQVEQWNPLAETAQTSVSSNDSAADEAVFMGAPEPMLTQRSVSVSWKIAQTLHVCHILVASAVNV